MSTETKNEKHSSHEEVKKPENKKAENKPETGKKEEKKTESKSIFDHKNKEIEELKKKNAELETQVAQLKNAYAKAYADTENTRKRLNKEFEQLSKYKIQDFALQVLPVLDDCERALAQETKDEAYRKGVQMIHDKLAAALAAEGVSEIECLNQPFDANWHQAIMSEHVDGVAPGTVVEVLQKGYKLKDRLLRAAMVKVSE
jgi:molecular chaperone GrpE